MYFLHFMAAGFPGCIFLIISFLAVYFSVYFMYDKLYGRFTPDS